MTKNSTLRGVKNLISHHFSHLTSRKMGEVDSFFKSAFSVDNVIFGFEDGELNVLLIQRGAAPFQGMWALPGDLVYPNEDLDAAAERVLAQLTGLRDVYLEQVRTFGSVNRHPLGRVITVAYYSLVKTSDFSLKPASFAQTAQWFSVDEVPQLAFDHAEILAACRHQLQLRARREPVGFELLPPKFTLTKLQQLYECLLQTKLEKRNFRKKVLSMDILVELEEIQEGVAHRPARYFQFDRERYDQALAEGFSFDIREPKSARQLAAETAQN